MNSTQNTPRAGSTPTPAALLRAAADYLNTHGWHRTALYLNDGTATPAACAIGAIHAAACGHPRYAHSCPHGSDTNASAYEQAVRAIAGLLLDQQLGPDVQYPDYSALVEDWNDDQHQTL